MFYNRSTSTLRIAATNNAGKTTDGTMYGIGKQLYTPTAGYTNSVSQYGSKKMTGSSSDILSMGSSAKTLYKTQYHAGTYLAIGIQGTANMQDEIYAVWVEGNTDYNFFSAAGDTVTYTEGGVERTFCITDENGRAWIDYSLLPAGTYTLKSSIAKNPNDLSQPYTKTVTINANTASIMLMPEGAIYWYGWTVNAYNNPTIATQNSSFSGTAATINGNDITIANNTAYKENGISIPNIDATGKTKLKVISNGATHSTNISGLGGGLGCVISEVVHANYPTTIWWNSVCLVTGLVTPYTIVARYQEQQVNKPFIVNAVWLE